ncbi:MAG: hypothetical protein ABIK37_06885, partial [candidate division WOR-3 bacterium]
ILSPEAYPCRSGFIRTSSCLSAGTVVSLAEAKPGARTHVGTKTAPGVAWCLPPRRQNDEF